MNTKLLIILRQESNIHVSRDLFVCVCVCVSACVGVCRLIKRIPKDRWRGRPTQQLTDKTDRQKQCRKKISRRTNRHIQVHIITYVNYMYDIHVHERRREFNIKVTMINIFKSKSDAFSMCTVKATENYYLQSSPELCGAFYSFSAHRFGLIAQNVTDLILCHRYVSLEKAIINSMFNNFGTFGK